MDSGVIVSALSGTAGAIVGAVAVLGGVFTQDYLLAHRDKVSAKELLEGELEAMCYLLLESRWWWVDSWKKRNVCARRKILLEKLPGAERLEIEDNYDELKFWRAKELAKSERLDVVLVDLHRLLVKIRQKFTEDVIREQCDRLSDLDLSRYFINPPDTEIDSLEKLADWQEQIEGRLTETNKVWEAELRALLDLVRTANQGNSSAIQR